MNEELNQYATKILRATNGRDVSEVFPVKIGELRQLCEALMNDPATKPTLSDKQSQIYGIIKQNPGRTVEEVAKELGYGRPLPLMNVLSQLASKGMIVPVKNTTDALFAA